MRVLERVYDLRQRGESVRTTELQPETGESVRTNYNLRQRGESARTNYNLE